MQLIISLTLFSVISFSSWSEAISDSLKDDSQKETIKTQGEDRRSPGAKATKKDLFYTPPQANIDIQRLEGALETHPPGSDGLEGWSEELHRLGLLAMRNKQKIQTFKIKHLGEPQSGEPNTHVVEFRAPHSVTKLAKTIAYGLDPYFNKGYFEPFESRPKLVTLVAFKKNGLIPKKSVQESEERDLEVAELQSPYNSINNYWMDPAEFRA